MMETNFFFEEAFDIIKTEVLNTLKIDETEKPLITDCLSFEFGWLFRIESDYYNNSYKAGKLNEKIFQGKPLYFIDKFDGEIIRIGEFTKEEIEEDVTMDEFIYEYFLIKYPTYWEEKRAMEEEEDKKHEELLEYFRNRNNDEIADK